MSSDRSVVLEPGFREQWQRLISEPLWAALVHLGVEEAADLAYLFSSQDETREWAVLQQCGADADRFLDWHRAGSRDCGCSSYIQQYQPSSSRARCARGSFLPVRDQQPAVSASGASVCTGSCAGSCKRLAGPGSSPSPRSSSQSSLRLLSVHGVAGTAGRLRRVLRSLLSNRTPDHVRLLRACGRRRPDRSALGVASAEYAARPAGTELPSAGLQGVCHGQGPAQWCRRAWSRKPSGWASLCCCSGPQGVGACCSSPSAWPCCHACDGGICNDRTLRTAIEPYFMATACRVRVECRGYGSRTPGQCPSSTIWSWASLSCLLLQDGPGSF